MDCKRISLSLSVFTVGIFATVAATDVAAQQATTVASRGASSAATTAAAPTYYGAVKNVLERNCVTCHTETPVSVGGMVAPFGLTSYESARRWSSSIARAVAADYMPPWDADIQHKGVFKNERYLPDEDKAALIQWAEAGAPRGDPSEAPPAVVVADVQEPTIAPDGSVWLMGVPDVVVGFDQPIVVCEEVEDWQPNVPQRVISGDLGQPRWIRATEINAGTIVHHTVSSLLGVGTPGRGPFAFPEGWGILMVPDQYMSISMHYHKETGPGTEYVDDTRGGIQFYEDGARIDYVVETDLQPQTDFLIPAGASNHPVENVTHFDEDIYLLSMGPHAHYRGNAVRIELQRPGQRFRETLLWVPDYDFNWQFQYELIEPLLIPAGSTMITTWYYDNSTANPHNPDPTVDVRYGAATTDEMSNSRIYYARTTPLGLVAGNPIPPEILERAQAADERARRTAREWEAESQSCAAQLGLASR